MEKTKNYKYKRDSTTLVEWLKASIASERYRKTDGTFINDLPEHFQ